MEKKTIEIPVYGRVQTGTSKKEVWITEDGKEFDTERDARYHEFYECKINRRSFFEDVILDLYCQEDLDRYIKDYGYNIDVFDYDKDILKFPNTYVLEEVMKDDFDPNNDCEDYWGDTELTLKVYTLEEYKKIINDRLDLIKPIK